MTFEFWFWENCWSSLDLHNKLQKIDLSSKLKKKKILMIITWKIFKLIMIKGRVSLIWSTTVISFFFLFSFSKGGEDFNGGFYPYCLSNPAFIIREKNKRRNHCSTNSTLNFLNCYHHVYINVEPCNVNPKYVRSKFSIFNLSDHSREYFSFVFCF